MVHLTLARLACCQKTKDLKIGGSFAQGIKTPVFDNRIQMFSTQDKSSNLKWDRHAVGDLYLKKGLKNLLPKWLLKEKIWMLAEEERIL